MSNAAVQLELHQAILAVIGRKFAESGDQSLGANIKRLILDTQFQELEHDILENPGVIEPWLTGRRGSEQQYPIWPDNPAGCRERVQAGSPIKPARCPMHGLQNLSANARQRSRKPAS